jgi:homocysteine S-methyltransferase
MCRAIEVPGTSAAPCDIMASMGLRSLLAAPGTVVIDGGLSTQLEAAGHDLRDPLWTARTLLDDPSAIADAHRAFAVAGAQVVITASYQVSREGFASVGLDRGQADDALIASVQAARAAVMGSGVLVAASVGPYGASSHDGAEYRGNYGRTERQLAQFHAPRIEVLRAAEPDLLAVETIPDILEVRALLSVLPTDVPAWVSVTASDGGRLRAGQPIEEAVAACAGHPAVMAVGINCTEPMHVPSLLQRMARVTDLPLIAYPNAGGSWDAASATWIGPRQPIGAAARDWVDHGARLVGGCCGTDAQAIGRLARAVAA